ncbi:hypothetical protein ACMV5I_26190 [Serratia sp. T13T92]|uniref:hypothetical protein n=1 Tax=Serratia sp. T13T92 TaxID=3397496 RepID=UPI0039E10E8F
MLFNLGWIKAHGCFFVLLLVSVSVRANITAQATRLVYHSDVSEANFRLENNFDKPALFQA